MNQKTCYIPALGFDVLTPLYDPLVALTTRERTFKRLLIEQAGIRPGHRVLDLACGTGTLAARIKQAVPGAVVVGIDGDERVLERARRKAARAGVALRLDQGLSTHLPYPGGSFDRVVSSLFFHHLQPQDKLTSAREACRVLGPGGRLHVADWGKPPNRLLRAAFGVVQLLDGFANTRDHVEGRLGGFFEQAGFRTVALSAQVHTPLGTMALYSAEKA